MALSRAAIRFVFLFAAVGAIASIAGLAFAGDTDTTEIAYLAALACSLLASGFGLASIDARRRTDLRFGLGEVRTRTRGAPLGGLIEADPSLARNLKKQSSPRAESRPWTTSAHFGLAWNMHATSSSSREPDDPPKQYIAEVQPVVDLVDGKPALADFLAERPEALERLVGRSTIRRCPEIEEVVDEIAESR